MSPVSMASALSAACPAFRATMYTRRSALSNALRRRTLAPSIAASHASLRSSGRMRNTMSCTHACSATALSCVRHMRDSSVACSVACSSPLANFFLSPCPCLHTHATAG